MWFGLRFTLRFGLRFEVQEVLGNEITNSVDPYLPKDWRSPASISMAHKMEKYLVQSDVCSLINYMNWAHQNAKNIFKK